MFILILLVVIKCLEMNMVEKSTENITIKIKYLNTLRISYREGSIQSCLKTFHCVLCLSHREGPDALTQRRVVFVYNLGTLSPGGELANCSGQTTKKIVENNTKKGQIYIILQIQLIFIYIGLSI